MNLSTLDKVFNAMTLEPPVLLKLDVQGYESTTLRGGRDTLKRVDYVILEASFKPMYEGEMLFMDIVRLMEEYGFQFFAPGRVALQSKKR
ncbi:methyltransferase, FkbM family [Candidatus Thiomargarita nelsonii]|uniref:Methyltransferase, FkbM family n=1 Tax=Candidatus Thiomargarita nelsonii TaxID=1003181 RepID=A0A176S5Q5_9GAMM|nr:methyltransferase, FkbM family [Candidatus Thiomargarita nelsonii]